MNAATTPRPFQLVAGHPVLDFINTLDWRFRASGPEDLLGSAADLFRFAEQSLLLTSAGALRLRRFLKPRAAAALLGSARNLRETLADVFYPTLAGTSPGRRSLLSLDLLLAEADCHRTLQWKGGRLDRSLPATAADPHLPLWLLATSASLLLTSPDITRVHACDNDDCRWLFLDTSRNGTRRWCDMKICGNRMKARRFKAGHRS